MNPAALELIAAVRRRAENTATRTDQSVLSPTKIAPVVPELEIARVESRLGLRIPGVLRLVYSTVGNGGFGPGYGLMGLPGGFTDDRGNSAVQLYEFFRLPSPKDSTWQWPAGVVPICHWGCAIYSCIDCSTDAGRVLIWDPNVRDRGTPVEAGLRSGHRSVAEWFGAWAAGMNIWDQMFPDADAARSVD